MDWYTYVWFALVVIPDKIIQAYNLKAIACNGYIYIEIQQVIYWLL